MSKELPIFIHSLFRSGSTYIFNCFRRSEQGYWCYQEPLNEILLNAAKDSGKLQMLHQNVAKHLRHPELDRPYFHEFHSLVEQIGKTFRPEFPYEDYFSQSTASTEFLCQYLKVLIDGAQGRPVLQECRSCGRVGIIRQCLEAKHLFLWRNPWDQWWSYKVDAHFEICNMQILASDSAPPVFVELRKILAFSPKNSDTYSFSAQRLNAAGSYMLFFALWCHAMLEARSKCNFDINIDTLSLNGNYRAAVIEMLSKHSIEGIDFSDCKVSIGLYGEEDRQFFGKLEERVLRLFLSHGYSESEIEKIHLFRADHDCHHSNRGQSNPNLAKEFDRIRQTARRLESELSESQRKTGLLSEALFNQAVSLQQSGQFTIAIQIYRQLIESFPKSAKVLFWLGTAEFQTGNYLECVKLLDKTLGIEQNNAIAYNTRGIALKNLKRLDEALQSYDRAIQLKPDYADANFNRGVVLNDLWRPEAALQSYDRAIQLNPGYAAAYKNRGISLHNLKRTSEAIQSYDRAIQLQPEDAEAYFGKAETLLLTGYYEEGWDLFEWRWKTKFRKRSALIDDYPLWSGDLAVKGKAILIHGEIGLGDFIMFSRYASLLNASGAEVVIYAPGSLVPLFKAQTEQYNVIEEGQPLPQIDFQCPIMSLPRAFKTKLHSIPARMPYLTVESTKQQYWHQKLESSEKLRVGVMWSGSVGRTIDDNPIRSRNLPLKLLESFTHLPIELHALQKEILESDTETLKTFSMIKTYQNELHDFSDTAALIQGLDLVISIDTSVAHLAGALGKPLWVMLPYLSDYRWMLEGSETPWYPTASLFRQKSAGDWESVISEITGRLKIMVS